MTKLHEISMWTPQGLELAPSRPPSRPSSRPSSGCSEEVHQNHLHLLLQTPWSGSPALVRCLASLKHGSVMVTFTFLLNCDQECIFVLQFVLLQQKPVAHSRPPNLAHMVPLISLSLSLLHQSITVSGSVMKGCQVLMFSDEVRKLYFEVLWICLGICLTILLQTFANTFTLNYVFAQARRTIIFDFWTARNFVSMASLTMELSLQTKSIRHALVQSYLEKLGVGKKAIHRLMRQPAEFPGLWYFIHRDGKD